MVHAIHVDSRAVSLFALTHATPNLLFIDESIQLRTMRDTHGLEALETNMADLTSYLVHPLHPVLKIPQIQHDISNVSYVLDTSRA